MLTASCKGMNGGESYYLSLLLSMGTRWWIRYFLIRFKSYFPELKPITGDTLMTFLRAPIKLLISSDCFRVLDFSIWSSFSFFIFYFSKTSSYLLSKMFSTFLLITFNLFRGSVYPGTFEEMLTDNNSNQPVDLWTARR